MLAVLASQMGEGGDPKDQSRVLQMVERSNSVFLAGSEGPCLISFALDSEVMSLHKRRPAGNAQVGPSDPSSLHGELCWPESDNSGILAPGNTKKE